MIASAAIVQLGRALSIQRARAHYLLYRRHPSRISPPPGRIRRAGGGGPASGATHFA